MNIGEMLTQNGYTLAASGRALSKWGKSARNSPTGFFRAAAAIRFEKGIHRAAVANGTVAFYKVGDTGIYDYIKVPSESITLEIVHAAEGYNSGEPVPDILQGLR